MFKSKKRALISGCNGQDGSYLCELLLDKGYEVMGILKRNSVAETQDLRIAHLGDKIATVYGDMTDMSSLSRIIQDYKPHEIYNLAAQSHVRISFDIPQFTLLTNGLGVLNMLEAIRIHRPKAKFYQASSCLPAGTKILSKISIKRSRNGKMQKFDTLNVKNIESLKPGDVVLSYNIKSGKKEYCKIKNIDNRIAENMYTIKFSNGNSLRLSGNHPIYVHNKGWIRTDKISIDDAVIQKTYPGFAGSRLRKGKTNIELYGKERGAKINKKCKEGQKNQIWYYYRWIDKYGKEKADKLLKKTLDKLKGPRPNGRGYGSWNTGLTAKTNNKLKNIGKKISKAQKKLWSNPEYAKRLTIAHQKNFNKEEQTFQKFLDRICPGEFKYNSGDLLVIERKIPDFVNIKGKNKVIEYNGDYWHKNDILGARKKLFKKNGYELLEIWGSEFKTEEKKIEKKILDFLYNPGAEIVKVAEIIKETKSERVYDIEVEKNHNFFAYGILVHNSEMFGNSSDKDHFQRLTTPMKPISPYGCAKLYAFNIVRSYRKAYKLHACNGILFNHESPRRGSNFVTGKVVKSAVEIKLGLRKKLALGNLDASRDWGHSKDYVKGMHMILNHKTPEDFILATGVSHTIRELCNYVFSKLDMDYKDYITQDKKYFRPEELRELKGDASKAREVLGWEPTYTFETLLDDMIEGWMEKLKNENI